MSAVELKVRKRTSQLNPDSRRVIARMHFNSEDRARSLIDRTLTISEEEVTELVERVIEDYGSRHRNIEDIFLRHYRVVKEWIPRDSSVSEARKLLIGSYFTMEYAIESAALFNPSIVPHPDQSGLPPKRSRVVLSLRAVGEGHISSIEFRSATIDERGNFHFDHVTGYVATARVRPDKIYDKHLFSLKLIDMSLTWETSLDDEALKGAGQGILEGVLNRLDDRFTFDQLREAISSYREGDGDRDPGVLEEACARMILLARSNYEIRFEWETDLSERVIYPVSSAESGGIEDARFVRFEEEDGEVTYYATYTAYDRPRILTQILETKDFLHFGVRTLNGKFAQSKGMALFPRRIDGKFAMISRIDGENLYLMYSDNIHFWDTVRRIQIPVQPWELVQIGNCGSPIETEKGWILLTHGVGPLRCYSIGATLLDLNDPSKIIGQLAEPLIYAEDDEREGYVPNVVYTCGAMIHNGDLIIPYAVSDTATRIASVGVEDLLKVLTNDG